MRTKQTVSEIWDEIKGKAHLYKTARKVESGEWIAIRGVICAGTFEIAGKFGIEHYGCHELTDYCL